MAASGCVTTALATGCGTLSAPRGRSVVVAQKPSKLLGRVRFPSPALGAARGCRRYDRRSHGEWRSLVAHPAGGRAVAGSNPVSPILTKGPHLRAISNGSALTQPATARAKIPLFWARAGRSLVRPDGGEHRQRPAFEAPTRRSPQASPKGARGTNRATRATEMGPREGRQIRKRHCSASAAPPSITS